MLASTCLPRRSWPNTGVPAFVPSPSLHAQDEPPRTTLSTWSSILYASGTESQHVNLLRSSRKRPRELSTVVGGGDASMTYRKISLSCLRGGSDSAGDDAPNAQSDEEDTSSSSNTAGLPPTATHTTTSSDQIKRQQQQEEVSKPFQRQQQGTHPPAAFGVSLVTERSTATGSSKGRVSYSVLADGTLQVGSHKRPTAATSSLQPSAPASAVRTTTPPLPRTAIAHPTPGRTPRNGPRKFLQGLGRCSQDLKTRVGQVCIPTDHHYIIVDMTIVFLCLCLHPRCCLDSLSYYRGRQIKGHGLRAVVATPVVGYTTWMYSALSSPVDFTCEFTVPTHNIIPWRQCVLLLLLLYVF